MKGVSVTEQVASLLEENWGGLKAELGGRWDEFLDSYSAVLRSLPPNPLQEDMARATIKLLGLLRQSEAGRRLLRNNSALQTRLIGSGPETLPNNVPVKLVANRLLDLLRREEARKREDAKPADSDTKKE